MTRLALAALSVSIAICAAIVLAFLLPQHTPRAAVTPAVALLLPGRDGASAGGTTPTNLFAGEVARPSHPAPEALRAGQGQVLAAILERRDGSRAAVVPAQLSGRLAPPVIGGRATWYRADGMIGAAGPMLRAYIGPHWRGSLIEVSSVATGQRIVVRLTDWCLCRHGRRLVDLSDDAFMQLAPLSKGVIGVTILRVVRNIPEPPPTDTSP